MKLDSKSSKIFSRRYLLRPTQLDLRILAQQPNSLWGFYVLFWFSGVLLICLTMYSNLKLEKSIIGSYLFKLSLSNFPEVVLFDLVMVLSTSFCFFLQKLIATQTISTKGGSFLQRVFEISFIGCFNYYIYKQNWNWASSGATCVHSISILFKMHSYNIVNIRLMEQYNLKKKLIQAEKKEDANVAEQIAEIDKILTIEVPHDLEFNGFDASPISEESVKFRICYPENVNISNFVDYLIVPTLSYDIAYPRMKYVRPLYIFEKVVEFIGTCFCLYVILENYTIPPFSESHRSFVDLLLVLCTPFMACMLLTFNIIFEVICNVCAEVTKFADRGNFYSDWWNSVNYLEFSRKWNKPVHNFLFRHVYLECLQVMGFSKGLSRFITFFISALFHELVFVVLFKEIKWYMFVIQMLQIPLIAFQELPPIKKFPVAGNVLFWFGMYCGLPLLCVAYNKL
eukprot:NODE_8_length_66115_cov_0.981823.p13 type:complete len:454 gc:universal NODE_8_length_66115_cov_0.981823:52263-53624(+)